MSIFVNDPKYTNSFVHYIINPKNINHNYDISIVMTTHDRQEQTLFTLNSINSSQLSSHINVILVDDSINNYIPLDQLENFNFQIDYIQIKNNFKTWINPCVNYNIGFNFIQTNKIIIQNSEVFHCNDIVQYVSDNLKKNMYLVFDVVSSQSLEENHQLYKIKNVNDILKHVSDNIHIWYQNSHSKIFNRGYHFLTAINYDDLLLTKGFNLQFANGSCYDDDEFIWRIKNKLNLNVISVDYEKELHFGVHQWHQTAQNSYDNQLVQINKQLFYGICHQSPRII